MLLGNQYIKIPIELQTRMKVEPDSITDTEWLDMASSWLPSGSTQYEIGGRDTEFSQITWSLAHTIRSAYAMNAVPDDIPESLKEIKENLEIVEKDLKSLLIRVTKDLAMKQIQAEGETS
jgi:hypothetical protein